MDDELKKFIKNEEWHLPFSHREIRKAYELGKKVAKNQIIEEMKGKVIGHKLEAVITKKELEDLDV